MRTPILWMLLFALAPSAAAAQGITLIQYDGAQTDQDQHTGFAVTGVGDWDGDGFADFAVSMPGKSDPNIPLAENGRVEIVSSHSTQVIGASAGALSGMHHGSALDGAADFDGDGLRDVLIGGPGPMDSGSNQPGQVRIFFSGGGNPADLTDGSATSGFGSAVAAVGDVNGDGFPDILVGAPGGAAGKAMLLNGQTHAVIATFAGAAGETQGFAVCALDDLDGDGVREFAVGAPFADFNNKAQAGVVRIYSGAGAHEVLRTLGGNLGGEEFGSSIASAPAMDKDTIDDVLVGAPAATVGPEPETGVARLFSGAKGTVMRAFPGGFTGGRFGSAVAGLGDVTGNGIGEVAVGGNMKGGGGRVIVYSGLNGNSIAVISGGVQNELGFSLANVGDVNADGIDDLGYGAPFEDSGGITDNGTLRIQSLAGAADAENGKLKGKRDCVRPATPPDADALGRIDVRFGRNAQRFVFTGSKLPTGDPLIVFLEDGVGVGTFTDVGLPLLKNRKSGLWVMDLNQIGSAPSALGVASITALAGRRCEIRNGADVVYLRTVVPPVGPRPVYKAAVALKNPQLTSSPKGTLTLNFTPSAGTSTFTVKTAGLPSGAAYSLEVETGPGTNVFTGAGALVKNAYSVTTKKGQPLPLELGTSADFHGRRVRVVQNSTTMLEGLVP